MLGKTTVPGEGEEGAMASYMLTLPLDIIAQISAIIGALGVLLGRTDTLSKVLAIIFIAVMLGDFALKAMNVYWITHSY